MGAGLSASWFRVDEVSRRAAAEGSQMSQPASERSDEQIARERASGKVSDVLLNIEYALTAAKKAKAMVAKDGVDINAELALADTVKDLERIRKRLMQDTYFAADTRLL